MLTLVLRCSLMANNMSLQMELSYIYLENATIQNIKNIYSILSSLCAVCIYICLLLCVRVPLVYVMNTFLSTISLSIISISSTSNLLHHNLP